MLNKSYKNTQKELDTLIDMRLKGFITDDEFKGKKKVLIRDLNSSKDSLDEIHNNTKDWVKKMEVAFSFAAKAREAFIKGDIDTKREILSALGKSYFKG